MAIEIIDGTVEAAVLKRSYAKVSMYDSITIRTAAGEERRLEKVAMAPDVAAMLQPGTDGRFYGYKAIDHRGLFAIRTRDGRSAYGLANGNERTMLMTTIIGWVSFVFFILVGKGIGLLALALGVLGGIGYFRYRKTRIEGRARYDADAGYA